MNSVKYVGNGNSKQWHYIYIKKMVKCVFVERKKVEDEGVGFLPSLSHWREKLQNICLHRVGKSMEGNTRNQRG